MYILNQTVIFPPKNKETKSPPYMTLTCLKAQGKVPIKKALGKVTLTHLTKAHV